MTVTARSRRVPLAGAALAAAALIAAGCGSPGSSPSASPAASAGGGASAGGASAGGPSAGGGASASPGGATAASSGSGASAPGSSESGSSGPGTSACATTDLKASVGAGQGAAGSDYTAIDFTNVGGHSCTLYGYPGMSLTSSSGRQIGAAATRDRTRAPMLVTLAPGATANAVLRVTVAQNYPTGTCGPVPATSLRIYPPNQTRALRVPYRTTGCSKSTVRLLSVSVVTPGAGDANG